MNKITLLLRNSSAAALLLATVLPASAVNSIDLTTFGAEVEGLDWTWNQVTSNLSGPEAAGAVLYPISFAGADFTTLTDYNPADPKFEFKFTGFVTTAPPGAFTITLEDNLANLSVTSFMWSSFGSSSSIVTNPITTPVGFNWANVVGWTLDSGGSGNTVNATFTQMSVTAVPSPTPAAVGGSFTARAPGGVRFLAGLGDTAGVTLTNGATSWGSLSDRNTKTKASPVHHREVLGKLAQMPVTSWEYKHDPGRRYIGPMAQDFHAAFGLGADDKRLSTLDLDGVAFSALQGLIAELRDRRERSAVQAARLQALENELQDLRERLAGR